MDEIIVGCFREVASIVSSSSSSSSSTAVATDDDDHDDDADVPISDAIKLKLYSHYKISTYLASSTPPTSSPLLLNILM